MWFFRFTMRSSLFSLCIFALNLELFALGSYATNVRRSSCAMVPDNSPPASQGCQMVKTVVFPVTLTWQKGAPDGFERDMIFTNGQYPGPTLNIQEGDNVEVRSASTL